MSFPLVLFPREAKLESSRSMRARPEGCEELLTFHCEHWVAGGSTCPFRPRLFSLSRLFIFLTPFVPSINDNGIQSARGTVKGRHIHRL